MNKETERLVNEVKRELRAIRFMVEKKENPELLKAYQKLLSTID